MEMVAGVANNEVKSALRLLEMCWQDDAGHCSRDGWRPRDHQFVSVSEL